ncbi:MAG: hypothetical protein Q8927_16610 [Bacteroidota bacterium]|nr:hypothetical protein [Bacteroidota bacterium]MDP4247499.1 hypothetical protein [Bacteroidota bacterium]
MLRPFSIVLLMALAGASRLHAQAPGGKVGGAGSQAPAATATGTATGSWYGKAEADVSGIHDNYLTELVIKQRGNRVDGVFGYYFRDKYQSFFVHGRYNPQTREVTILNIPVIYFGSNSTVNSIDCNMNFRAILINSKFKSTLKGYFYHDARYAHMCPDLKVAYTLDRNEKQDSVLKASNAVARIWKPQVDDNVFDAAKEDAKKNDSAMKKLDSMVAATIQAGDTSAKIADTTLSDTAQHMADVSQRVAAVLPGHDSVATVAAPPPDPEKLDKEDSRKIAESFVKRAPVNNKVLEVESDSVRVSFYDNGEIDGDSISVFVNQQLVLKHQMLESRALVLFLRLDSALETNEISMFAENLGKYPPNTALMVVTDGKHRYEVFMSSNYSSNATIRLRRKKKA